MNDKFQVGDVVCHKSNPKMKMVICYAGKTSSQCNWIISDGECKSYLFDNKELLKFVDESKTANKIRAEYGYPPIPGPLDV